MKVVANQRNALPLGDAEFTADRFEVNIRIGLVKEMRNDLAQSEFPGDSRLGLRQLAKSDGRGRFEPEHTGVGAAINGKHERLARRQLGAGLERCA